MATGFETLSPVMFESVSNVTATNSVDVGTRRSVAGNDYIYVYNAGNSQVSKGYGCVMSGTTGYSVTVSAVTQLDFAVGINKHATAATATYFWAMTRGFSTFVAGANDSFTTGDPIALAVDGAWANKTISTGYVSPVVGKAVQGAASITSTGYGYFRFD